MMALVDAAFAAVAISLAALVVAGISLIVSLRAARISPAETLSEVRKVQLDVAELFDKVDHWTRRDRVRNVREGKTRAAEARANGGASMETMDPANYKAYLRQLAFGGGSQIPGDDDAQ